MLPTLVDEVPEGEDWLHEIKYEGFRTQIVLAGGRARAITNAGEDWTARYRPLVAAAEALGVTDAILDGEAIVQDEAGRSDVAALQEAIVRAPERLVFMAFDLLYDGRDLRSRPLEERRARLQDLIGTNDPGRVLQFSGHVEGGGQAFFEAAKAMGLAGIVSKRLGSRYRSGPAADWLAIRTSAADPLSGDDGGRGLKTSETAGDDPAAAGPKPIPGTARGPTGELSYKKPRLPDRSAMIGYYRQLAPLLLRHAGHRPLNLFRCTAGHCFFQRNRNHPASGTTFAPPIRFVPISQKNGRTEDYLWVADEAGVIACAEADGIEFHGWGAQVGDVERPDRIAFDLDPGEGTGFAEVKAAALTLRRVLDELGLASFPLLSGGKGIHVVVPLSPDAEWPAVRDFAHRLCAGLAAAERSLFTVALPKVERKGRIFLDYLRNQRSATAILPYSLRARPGAPAAAPLAWSELDETQRASRFTIADADLLAKRARSRALKGWGEVEQILPRLA